jgi:YggT family protein
MIIVYYLLLFLDLVFFARAVLSWFPNVDHSNPLIRFVFEVTEPILRPIRQALPQTGMIDFSVWIVVIVLGFLMQLFR